MPTDLAWLEKLSDAGAAMLLLVAVLGGFRGWYVWRWVYDEQKAETVKAIVERDEWKQMALHSMGLAKTLAKK